MPMPWMPWMPPMGCRHAPKRDSWVCGSMSLQVPQSCPSLRSLISQVTGSGHGVGALGCRWAAGGYWWWEKPSRSASDKLGTTSSSSPRQAQDAAILPACPCEQPTTRNKSEIVTIHTDFHHATFPPISSPREKPRGRPPPSGAHPKIRACDWSSSACRALIGREPAEFPAQKRSLKGWVGCATRLVCLSSAAELSFDRSALQTDGSQGASSALLANNHFLSDGDTHQHRVEHQQENKKYYQRWR